MANEVWYSIRNNRIKQGSFSGFKLENDNKLTCDKDASEHYIFLKPIDGVFDDATWGRFTCELSITEETVCYIYVYATNALEVTSDSGERINLGKYLFDESVDHRRRIELLSDLGAKRVVNTDDFLLYDLNGRYLFTVIELSGSGNASISSIRIGAKGDGFMQNLPEVYRERNSFLHRYLSIFSSIYNDISEQNEKLYEMLDLDECSPELLEMYASWFGINLKGGSLPERVLRTVVKDAYQLNRMKGTRWSVERILQIMLGDDYLMYENRLSNGNLYDVTVLVNKKLTEQLRHQLVFLLDQFKPLRVNIRLMQMEKEAVMDGNNYLDVNASIPSEKHVVLDEEAIYEGTITLT
ncbi:MAG: hypothetical protein J5802_07990 [Butyrivibrio sp.]|nr:hypothetical protein [Butyrivibrio sp.]